MKKPLYIILLIANALVLLGVLWPQAVPPFAHTVNVATLAANLVVFALLLSGSSRKKA
jgi:hypothetical protein